MIVYLDFDGTVVTHEFPHIGRLLPNVQNVLTKLNTSGHQIIINTLRADFGTEHFPQAIEYVKKLMGRDFSYTERKIEPPKWDIERAKETGQLFIDDAAEGIPLFQFGTERRASVDWIEVERQLIEAKIVH